MRVSVKRFGTSRPNNKHTRRWQIGDAGVFGADPGGAEESRFPVGSQGSNREMETAVSLRIRLRSVGGAVALSLVVAPIVMMLNQATAHAKTITATTTACHRGKAIVHLASMAINGALGNRPASEPEDPARPVSWGWA